MLCNPYQPGNPFSRYCSVADAAIEWQGLTAEQLELVLVDETGIPFLAGCPALTDRANAIVEAVQEHEIGGHTHTEDGYPRRPDKMMLSRDNVNAWMAKANTRIATPPPEVAATAQPVLPALMTTTQVCTALGWSRSKLIRNTYPKGCKFPEPTHPGKGGSGHQWRAQVVQDYIENNPDELGEGTEDI